MPGSPERQRESIISLGVEAERALRHRTLCNCGPGPWWPGLPRPAPPFWLTAIRMAARQPPSTSASYSTLRCRRPSALASRYSSLASRLSSLVSRLSPLAFARACTLCSHSWSVNHLSDSRVASLLVVRSRRSLNLSSNNHGSQLRFVSARRKDDRSVDQARRTRDEPDRGKALPRSGGCAWRSRDSLARLLPIVDDATHGGVPRSVRSRYTDDDATRLDRGPPGVRPPCPVEVRVPD